MNKRIWICDLCKKREADKRFKVKYREPYTTLSLFSLSLVRKWEWKRIDLCDECYSALTLPLKKDTEEKQERIRNICLKQN